MNIFFSDRGSSPTQLPPTFLIMVNLIFPRYFNNMKNNKTIRRVKCIRPAARLVNWGPNTTQSLSFSLHLIQLSASVRPAARLVTSRLNRSQLSSIMRSYWPTFTPSFEASHFYFIDDYFTIFLNTLLM